MRAGEFIIENVQPPESLKTATVYRDFNFLVGIDGADVSIIVLRDPQNYDNQMAYAVLGRDGKNLYPDDLWVHSDSRGKGIASAMYDYLKELGFKIHRIPKDQTSAGKKFWQQHRGKLGNSDTKFVWENKETTLKKYYYLNIKNKLLYETVLNELNFQKRWELVTDTGTTNKIKKQILDSERDNTGKYLNVYQKVDDPTQIIISDIEDDYFNVHHSLYDPNSEKHRIGIKLGINPKPNIGFFSTIVSLYLDALSKGLPVKVSAVDKNMWKTYNRVLEKLAEKHLNYHLGKAKRELDRKYGVLVYSRVIIPRSKSPIDYRENMIKSIDK